jgi:hypothetical protein
MTEWVENQLEGELEFMIAKGLCYQHDAIGIATVATIRFLLIKGDRRIAELTAQLEAARKPVGPLSQEPAPSADRNGGRYLGKDCPVGMVQVEFVGCSPSERCHDYGWKPVKWAFLEVYVDGKRFHITVGDLHDGRDQRRGVHIIADVDVGFEQTAINSASAFLKRTAERSEPAKEGK